MNHQAEPEAGRGDGAAAAGTDAGEAGAAEARTDQARAEEARAEEAGSGEAGSGEAGSEEAHPETGEPRVDAALTLLDQLNEQPVTEHAAVFEQVHAELTAVLGQIDPESAGTDG